MYSKNGQVTLIAFFKVLVAVLLFFPLLSIYGDFRPYLLETITNPFIVFIIVILPFVYWIGVAFLFINTIKGASQ